MLSVSRRTCALGLVALLLSTTPDGSRSQSAAPQPTPTVAAGGAVYIPHSYDGDPVSSSPWITPTKAILLPRMYGWNGSDIRIVKVVDLKTGEATPLDSVNSVLKQKAVVGDDGKISQVPYSPFSACLSPNGRWLLWMGGTEEAPVWLAAAVDGSGPPREWPSTGRHDGGGHKAAWMRDSVHWVDIGQRLEDGAWRTYARVHSIDATAVQEFPVRHNLQGGLLPPFPNSQFTFTTDGRAWIVSWCSTALPGNPPTPVTCGKYCELIPGRDEWELRETMLPFQRQTSQYVSDGVMLSPNGQWIVCRDSSDHDAGVTRIVVCRRDGADARAVFTAKGMAYSPSWSPDARRIIFHWSGTAKAANLPNGEGLYIVDVTRLPDSPPSPAGLFPTREGKGWDAASLGR